MEFGREIAVNGVRPGWLEAGTQGLFENTRGKWFERDDLDFWTWDVDCNDGAGCPIHIRLPADHWVYRVLDWNDAHPDQEPFEPWAGGDAAPEDWDGGETLKRAGHVWGTRNAIGSDWRHEPEGDPKNLAHLDIIGIRRKRTAAAQPDMVQVRRMGAVEAREYARNITGLIPTSHFLDDIVRVLHALGIVEPTEAERIAEATGLTVDVVQKVLDAQ